MTIYVCCSGERHEGQTPYAAFYSKNEAERYSLAAANTHAHQFADNEHPAWDVLQLEDGSWIVGGCDTFSVQEIELR